VGTLQRISFQAPVTAVSEDAACVVTGGPLVFEYEVKPGYCYFTFQDVLGNYLEWTIFGYQTFVIRG
jgi:hypothetical protein